MAKIVDPAIMQDSDDDHPDLLPGDQPLQNKFVVWVFMNSFAGDGWKPKQLGEFRSVQQFWNIY